MRDLRFYHVLRSHGFEPSEVLLYRHSGTSSDVVRERETAGRDQLLSYFIYQSPQKAKAMANRKYTAHFIGEVPMPSVYLARFLGITECLGEPQPFDFSETDIVQGYVRGEAKPHAGSGERWAIPLRWADQDFFEAQGEPIVIGWGPYVRAAVRKAEGCSDQMPIIFNDLVGGDGGAGAYQKSVDGKSSKALQFYEYKVARNHFRVEANTASGTAIKNVKGLICEGCGLDAERAFGRNMAMSCMDAHHLDPRAEIPSQGRTVAVEDFAVLCATCHRLIHRLDRPDDLDGLRNLVRGLCPHNPFSKNTSG